MEPREPHWYDDLVEALFRIWHVVAFKRPQHPREGIDWPLQPRFPFSLFMSQDREAK